MQENQDLNSEELNIDETLNEVMINKDEAEDEECALVVPTSQWIVYEWDSNRNIVTEMETCYLEYAMSVIVSRALPDIRDWLKPVHRRILFSMHEQGLTAGAKYRKSATVVWHVLWNYHPHGDSSVYEAMVRMAQDFSLRYPLVNGQWNFWSMDWDNAAAYRYTEAKMTKLAEFMLSDIDKETVDWRDNFDTTKKEPTVLPARLPNLLMNWVMWIAVWMATNIPPHNLTELIDAIEYLMKVPEAGDITVEDLMQFVKWPDFPTGWIVYDKDALLTAYSTGRWSVVIRWVANIEENSKWRKYINISEIPYGLNKANFVMKIADLVRDKIIIWISDIRDESTQHWVRVIIELKKDAFPKKILNQLYKLTPLQTSFGYNMIWLWERWRQPRLHNLKDFLLAFIDHRKEVVTRRTQYELWVAEARAHILEWLKKALDHIDEIIATIKAANTKEEARNALIMNFGFSEIQAEAILEMKLNKLAWLERQKLEDELNEKLLLIADLKDILAKPERVVEIIITDLDLIKETFGDARRTQVNSGKVWEFNAKDTIPNEDVVIVLSKNDYIKRVKSNTFRTQKRGWRWVTTWAKENDEIKLVVSTRNHNALLFFTSKWRVFNLDAHEIPETARTAKWQAIVNILSLQKDETISAVLDITEEKNKYLFFVTQKWVVKKLDMELVKKIRSSWLIVLWIKEDDTLSWVRTTSGENRVFIATKQWKAIQFDENDVRPMWRAAAWVRWIKLKTDDEVVEVTIVAPEDKYVLVVSENWLGKISELDEYKEQNRWWSWVKTMAITVKTWKLISAMTLSDESRKELDLLLISKWGQTIRMSLDWIRSTSRVTQWVILTKVRWEDDVIVSASLIKTSEDLEEAGQADIVENEEIDNEE